MTFKQKDPRDAIVQLNTPVAWHLRSDINTIAEQRGQSVAELSRECFEQYLANELEIIRANRQVEDEIIAAHRAKMETAAAGATR